MMLTESSLVVVRRIRDEDVCYEDSQKLFLFVPRLQLPVFEQNKFLRPTQMPKCVHQLMEQDLLWK